MITEIATFATEIELKKVTVNEVEKSVMNSRIAIKQGKDRTSFINVTAWGRLAEYIGSAFKKGDEIYIEGEIKNYNFKTDERTLQTNYILIRDIKTTYGRKSRRLMEPITEIEDESLIDTD